MGSTTPYGLPYPDLGVGNDLPRDFKALADSIAPKLYRAEPLTGTQITAISSPRIGQLAMNTDTGRVQFWNGTAWGNVGGSAFGVAALGSLSLTTTFQTFAVFVGFGFQSVTIALSSASGSTTNGGVYGTAVSDATRFRGINVLGASGARMFTPQTTTDVAQAGIASTTSSQVRNIRLDSDGYLRMELGLITGGPNTTGATDRVTWEAR